MLSKMNLAENPNMSFIRLLRHHKYRDTLIEQSFMRIYMYLNENFTRNFQQNFSQHGRMSANSKKRPLDRGGSLIREFEPPKAIRYSTVNNLS